MKNKLIHKWGFMSTICFEMGARVKATAANWLARCPHLTSESWMLINWLDSFLCLLLWN